MSLCKESEKPMVLENSNFINGKQAKEVDTLIKEYQDITARLNDLDTSKKEVLKKLFELSELGVNETLNYTYKVLEQAGRQSLSLKTLQDKEPTIYAEIQEKGLITQGEPFKKVSSIKLKGARS